LIRTATGSNTNFLESHTEAFWRGLKLWFGFEDLMALIRPQISAYHNIRQRQQRHRPADEFEPYQELV
jgi:hypothetical protein